VCVCSSFGGAETRAPPPRPLRQLAACPRRRPELLGGRKYYYYYSCPLGPFSLPATDRELAGARSSRTSLARQLSAGRSGQSRFAHRPTARSDQTELIQNDSPPPPARTPFCSAVQSETTFPTPPPRSPASVSLLIGMNWSRWHSTNTDARTHTPSHFTRNHRAPTPPSLAIFLLAS
jgi:hypothetical protein